MVDPIADFLTRIRNGYQARKTVVEVPYSKIKEQIGKILTKEGYLKKIETEGMRPQEKKLLLTLFYKKKEPEFLGIRRISKPSVRIYGKVREISRFGRELGTVILSTSQGVMTDKEAKKKKIGGEVICRVW